MGHQFPVYDVVIIGGGPAGSSAAIYTARANHKTLVLDKGLSTGALGVTEKISNFPGVPGPISGAEIVKSIRSQAESFGAKFETDKVIGVDFTKEIKTVFTSKGMVEAKAVILATGSLGRKAATPGEKDFLGKGVSYCATCDGAFYRGHPVAVIGNNDEAVEELLFLTQFASKVYLISPTSELKAEEALVQKLKNTNNVETRVNTALIAVEGERTVSRITVQSKGLEQIESLSVDGVFIYLQGAHPVTEYLAGHLELAPAGCIKVDSGLQTSVSGVFAVGDLICSRVRQAVVAAADGVVAAISVDKHLRGVAKARLDWVHR